MRVELTKDPDGTEHYAVLRDAETVRGSERRLAVRATDAADGSATKDITYTDTLIAALLVEWNVELPMPSCRRENGKDVRENYESFEDLKAQDYDALRDAAVAIYAEARGITAEPDVDPESPTSPSSD